MQANCLKMYSGYINNYDNAMQILTRLKDKSAWMTYENATRLHPDCKMLRLEDFLIQAHSLPPLHRTRHATRDATRSQTHRFVNSRSSVCRATSFCCATSSSQHRRCVHGRGCSPA